MMHKPARVLGLLLCTILLNGCAPKTTRLQIESFKQTPSQTYTEHFENGVYALDPHNNWDLVFEVPPTWTPTMQLSSATQPATGGPQEGDSPRGDWSSQLLHIKVFWTPYPGRTYAESTQTNAAIHYYLYLGDEVMCYEGAGFVYFQPPGEGGPFTGRLESASLSPVGGKSDLFGPCRLTGEFVARRDVRKTVEALQIAHRKRPNAAGPPQ